MKRLEDSGTPSGGGEMSREALEQRVRELEEENRQLQAKMAKMESDWDLDRQALESYHQLGMPLTEEEMLERARTGPTLGDVLAECEREFADGGR